MNTSPALQESGSPRWHLPFGKAIIARIFRGALVVAFALGGLYLCVRLAIPFFTPLTAAFVLAVLFSPLHQRICAHVRRPSVAALIAALTIAAIVLALLGVLVAQIVREAAAGAELVRNALERGSIQQLFLAHPKAALMLEGVIEKLKAADLAADAASWLTNTSAFLLRGSVIQVAGILLTFYLLFYFLRDRSQVLGAMRAFLPFTEAETTVLFASAVDTVHATIYGLCLTGILLGLVGGGIFAIMGLPAPVLWGSVMAVFAILPVLGIGMVWMPAAAWLAFHGDWTQASLMSMAFVALSVADSVIYPYLLGNRMRLHTAVAFIAAIGGLIVFGPVGFIIGPLVFSLTITLRDILYGRMKTSA